MSACPADLFFPLSPWADLIGASPPGTGALNAQAEAGGVLSGSGLPLRFVPCPGGPGYEARIWESGEVPTRPGSWHDAFNALVWLAFPHAKAALNRRHAGALGLSHGSHSMDGMLAPRGPVRDAATQFDEDGVVVVSASPAINAALLGFRWREVWWERRDEFRRSVRVVIFGHALFDKLQAPFFGLCGRAVFRHVPASVMALPERQLVADTDGWLAGQLAEAAFLAAPSDLHPLPMLGIPGVTPDNADAAYYDDKRQFRPGRRMRSA